MGALPALGKIARLLSDSGQGFGPKPRSDIRQSPRHCLQQTLLPAKRCQIQPEPYRPMSIDITTAAKVAKLARIRVDAADLPDLAQKLSGIFDLVEQLKEVDVTGVEPMVSVTPMRLKRRVDVVTDGNIQAQVLKNAPDAREGFFAVPKVVE